jgi:hypothetical protein
LGPIYRPSPETLFPDISDKDFNNENEKEIYESLPKLYKTKDVESTHTLRVPEGNHILQFDSKFENSNLK